MKKSQISHTSWKWPQIVQEKNRMRKIRCTFDLRLLKTHLLLYFLLIVNGFLNILIWCPPAFDSLFMSYFWCLLKYSSFLVFYFHISCQDLYLSHHWLSFGHINLFTLLIQFNFCPLTLARFIISLSHLAFLNISISLK